MSQKRVAAAEVFRQQNIAQMADNDYDESDGIDYFQEEQAKEVDVQASMMARAPMQAQGYAGSAPMPPSSMPARGKRRAAPPAPPMGVLPTSEELQMQKEPIRVRETRFLF